MSSPFNTCKCIDIYTKKMTNWRGNVRPPTWNAPYIEWLAFQAEEMQRRKSSLEEEQKYLKMKLEETTIEWAVVIQRLLHDRQQLTAEIQQIEDDIAVLRGVEPIKDYAAFKRNLRSAIRELHSIDDGKLAKQIRRAIWFPNREH